MQGFLGVIGGELDVLMTPGIVSSTASFYGVPPVIVPNLAHDVMLGPGWEAGAEALLACCHEGVNTSKQ